MKDREEALSLKGRLGRMEDSKVEFLKIIQEKRNAVFKVYTLNG